MAGRWTMRHGYHLLRARIYKVLGNSSIFFRTCICMISDLGIHGVLGAFSSSLGRILSD